MKQPFAGSGTKPVTKYHDIPHEEVNALFQKWGIVGACRRMVVTQKSGALGKVYYFDKGPGPLGDRQ